MTFQHHSSGKPSLNRYVGFRVRYLFLVGDVGEVHAWC